MASVRATNKFLTDAEPWKLKGDENDIMRQKVGRSVPRTHTPLPLITQPCLHPSLHNPVLLRLIGRC